MEKWEYCWLRGVDPSSDQGIAQINELGLQGWEAVNFSAVVIFMIMFKRRLP